MHASARSIGVKAYWHKLTEEQRAAQLKGILGTGSKLGRAHFPKLKDKSTLSDHEENSSGDVEEEGFSMSGLESMHNDCYEEGAAPRRFMLDSNSGMFR